MVKNMRKQTDRNQNASILQILCLSMVAILMLGCEQPAQKTADQPNPVQKDNPVSQATQIVLDGLSDPEPGIRAKAIEVVATTGQVRMMPRVQRLLKDQLVPIRFLAVLAVGDLQYSLARSDIVRLLKDENENVRIAAAYAMTQLGSPEYFKVFRNAVGSRDQTVRANAALLLGKSGNKEALKSLYWTLQQKDSADKVILQAAESIALLGDERIYPKLWTRLISAYADDRVLGVRAMGALGTEQARNALITMLNDSVPEVRLAAAEQLGKLKDTTGESVVLAVLKKNLASETDPETRVRLKVLATMAIGEIGTDNLARLLPQLLQDESRLVRIAAAKAVLQSTTSK